MHVVNGSILTKCTLFLVTSHTEQLLPRPVVVSASVQCQLGMSTVCVYVDPEMDKVCYIYFALPAMTCVHVCL